MTVVTLSLPAGRGEMAVPIVAVDGIGTKAGEVEIQIPIVVDVADGHPVADPRLFQARTGGHQSTSALAQMEVFTST